MEVRDLEVRQIYGAPEPVDDFELLAHRRLELLAARKKLAKGEAISDHIAKMRKFPALAEKIKKKEIDPNKIAKAVIKEEVRLAELNYESAKRKAGISA